MIKSVNIKDFKGIKQGVTIEFLDGLPMHIMFGSNQSGKTTIFNALKHFKDAFTLGMRGINRLNDITQTSYVFEFIVDQQHFIFKTVLNYDKGEILYESLDLKTKSTIYNYYVRDAYEITIGQSLEKLFSSFDFERFKTYLYDLRFDRREFILSHLRIKDFSDSKGAMIIHKLCDELFSIHVFTGGVDIQFYEDLKDANYMRVLKLIQSVAPNIVGLQYKEVSLDTLRFNLNRHRYDHLLDAFRNYVTKHQSSDFFVRVYDQFYKISGRTLDELSIKTLDIHFDGGNSLDFSHASSGVKKLLLLSMILINSKTHDLVMIDDLTRDLDHKSAKKLIQALKNILKNKHIKLVFSSHDTLLLDSALFDLKEILYVTQEDEVKLYDLSKLGIRKDKKLLNLYDDGYFDTLK